MSGRYKRAILFLLAMYRVSSVQAAEDAGPTRPSAEASSTENLATRGPRRPIRIVADGKSYWVANRRSGTIARIPYAAAYVASETHVGERLADLVAPADAHWLAVADDRANQVILAQTTSDEPIVVDRVAVAGSPDALLVRAQNRELWVGSRWARQITVFDIARQDERPARLARRTVVDLPFSPGCWLSTPDDDLVLVADAFGPYLAVIRASDAKLVRVVQLPGHHLHGMALTSDGQNLLVAHQMLNSFVPSSRDHVFWGNMLSNLLRWIPLASLTTPGPVELASAPRLYGAQEPLGGEGHGAGDPTGLTVSPQGDMLLALSGTGEIAWRRAGQRSMLRMHVGQRPLTPVWTREPNRAVVVSYFEDAVLWVDLSKPAILARLTLGPAPPATLADRGEQLFFDASRSLHGWFSCHSCHTEGHTCGQLNDNLGDDNFGAPKRIPSLLGTADTTPWAWTGTQTKLVAQIDKSLRQTMHGDEQQTIAPPDLDALVAYLQTLSAPPGILAARNVADEAQRTRGEQVFAEHDCRQCHRPPTYTTPETYDVQLRDEAGQMRFNPPSLLGVSQRGPWLHDGRCRSLADVLKVHPTRQGTDLAAEDEAALLFFLNSL